MRIEVLTWVIAVDFLLIQLGHFGFGDVFVRCEEQNHLPFFILDRDDVQQAPKWRTYKQTDKRMHQ